MATKTLVTKADYFMPRRCTGEDPYTGETYVYYENSICDILCQDRISALSEAFDRFLSDISCKRTYDSEWYYHDQHSGIHATWDTWSLECFEPDEVEWRAELITKPVYDAWNSRVPRIKAIKKWLDNHENHLEDAVYIWGHGYLKRSHRTFSRRKNIMERAYERAIEDALEAVCDEYEALLEYECDYYYSDEGAEDWVRFQNEEE